MKTDSTTLELYTAGQSDRQVTAEIHPNPVSLPWLGSAVLHGGGSVQALLYTLLLHGALLLLSLVGWRLLPMEQAPPSVISVFTLQQEGEPEAPGIARSKNAPTIKQIKDPTIKEIHDNKEVGSEIAPSLVSSSPAKPEPGRLMTSEPPMPATAQQGTGSGSPAPSPSSVGGTSEGATTGEVLARPLYTTNPPPPYPRLARKLGHEGVVQLEALVSVTGRVDDLRIAASSGHESLDAAALEAVRSWRFSAGQRNGQPVAMRVRVPVRFSLRAGS